MKILSLSLLICFALFSAAFGQDKTDEKKWTINPDTRDTVYTESVIVSQNEDITPRNSMIIINPLKFLLFYNLSYYHKVGDQSAIGVGVQLPTIKGINGFGANAEVRLYPSGKNLRGFYFAPNISYNSLSGSNGDGSISLFSVGGLVGWQWFPGDQFAIGLGIGADYYFLSDNQNNNDDFESYSGMAPALRFDIGYAW
jgi:hypothetical protein